MFFYFLHRGKLTQRDNSKQTSVVHTKDELFELLLSPMVDVSDMYFVNEDTTWVSWSYNENVTKSMVSTESRNLSLVTGAYTTAQARLKLYEELYKLGDRVLYCDTDSIIFLETDDPLEYKPQTGANIGDLTDEILKYSSSGKAIISEFCSVGPKSYSLRIKKNGFDSDSDDDLIEVSKLKGFICTSATKKHLSFDNYKKMVFGSCDVAEDGIDSHIVYSKTMNINRRKHFNVVTVEQQKDFGYTFDKRIVNENFTTIPFGYKKK